MVTPPDPHARALGDFVCLRIAHLGVVPKAGSLEHTHRIETVHLDFQVLCTAWSPDDRWCALGSYKKGVYVFPISELANVTPRPLEHVKWLDPL